MLLSRGCRVIFVPQLLEQAAAVQGAYRWWIPFVPDKKLGAYLERFNRAMQEVASEKRVDYAGSVLEHAWSKDDFFDVSHLNAAGNRKFAALLKEAIIRDSR